MSVHTPERSTTTPNGSAGRPQTSYRPEVQGLRALAVLMVVTYHIWFGRVSGGVDVFLLVSAFLLTLSFMRKVESGKPLALGRYWLHLFKRLLPAVAVVMLATLLATFLFVPQSRWQDILGQAWASLLYFQNWLLAANSVDYYAADHSLASPLQHFWSLSVQGQVFILWPAIFAAAAVLAKVGKLRFSAVVWLLFGTLFVVSLAFSIHQTYTNQAYAYFDTRTRLWEFALGTLLALALPYVNLPRTLRIVAGWIGLAAMLSGGFVLDVEREFPGYVALWPLVAAGLVILAGQTGSRVGADRLLSWQPLVRMGDISYALYLWHWPLLVIYLIARNQSAAGPLEGSLIIAVSLVLAYLTTRFVERPLRESSWVERRRRRAAVVIVACVVLVATPLAVWQQNLRWEAERLAAQTAADNPGALALLPEFHGERNPDAPVKPAATEMGNEWAALPGKCDTEPYAPDTEYLAQYCSDNLIEGQPSRTVVVVGDSHAQQWMGVLEPMAREEGWKLVALLEGGCDFGSPEEAAPQECKRFNGAAMEYVDSLQPDAVFTVATSAHPTQAQDTVVPGYETMAAHFSDAGIEVIGIRDNPRYSFNMMACLEAEGGAEPCTMRRDATLNNTPPFAEIQQDAPAVKLLDMTDLICSPEECSPIVGNMHVYMDDNHLTKTFVASMLPVFSDRFKQETGW